ncbi:MAG: LysR family transcriptional regulator [Betaproteobacteria bacterium]|nr:LysR family transcriptional regulator [Betaproteobacteria bacterium]
MDTLRAIKFFVRLADLGSFTLVANEKNLSKSIISKEISRLEATLSARLLQRSTRKIQLTEAGNIYLQHCREILIKLNDAEALVQDLQQKPHGILRINAPMALGITNLSTLFAEFMHAYPDIKLDIHLGDEPIDILDQGFDIGFRVTSQLSDSAYIGRALTDFSYRVCAAPAYLESHAPINNAQDLLDHNCFIYSYFRGRDIWPLGDGVKISGNLKVNSTPFMMEAIKSGLGIGFIPSFVCNESLKQGDVTEILAEINRPKLTLYAIYPARKFVAPKLTVCMDFIQQWFLTLHKP